MNLPKALGNVRSLAEAIKSSPRGHEATARRDAGAALYNLQDQIDQLIFALKNKIGVKLTTNDTTPTDGSVRTNEPYPWATVDPPTPIAVAELLRFPNFGLKQRILKDVDGVVTPQFLVSGRAVVNVFSEDTEAPVISLSYTPTGGTIPGGIRYSVGVWAADASGQWTKMSLKAINVPADTNTNTISVTVTFKDPTNDSGWVAISPLPPAGWYGPNAEAIAVGNTAYTFTSIGDQLNTPVPDENFDRFLVQARTAYMLGVTGANVAAFSNGGKTLHFTGYTWGNDQLVGRTLSAYFKADPTQPLPIIELEVLSNTADTITVDEDVTALGAVVGDGFLVSTLATTHTANTIGDSALMTNNAEQPAGLEVDRYIGQLVVIVEGTGAGTYPVPIASNTATVVTTAIPFDVTPDATSKFIIISAIVDSQFMSNSLRFSALSADGGVILPLTVNNVRNHYFIQVLTVSPNGLTSDQRWSPFRWIFQFGFNDELGPPQYEWTVGFDTGGTPGDIPMGGTSELLTVDVAGSLHAHRALSEVGPTGDDNEYDVLAYKGSSAPVSVFVSTPTLIVVPDGTPDRENVTTQNLERDTLPLDVGDRLQLVVTKVGSTINGKRGRVSLWVKSFDFTLAQ